MSAAALAQKLIHAKAAGKLPKVVVPVHFAGQSCDMEAIHGLSREYGFRVIEDASHAVGARYQGKPVGSCQYSDITVFSFHPVKIITTAEGGMALTSSADLSARMERLRSHGITRDPSLMTGPSEGPWYYQQIDLGMNYRMADLHAALGASQMSRLDAYVARRHEIAGVYDRAFAPLPVITPFQSPDGHSAMHLYVIRLKSGASTGGRRALFDSLRESGIGVNVHYIPVHLQPYYQKMGFRANDYPEAESYYANALSLPMFPTMTGAQQNKVIAALQAALM
jgi:dTDP-4-amino-4,6-dideoxygalactose transaminase